MGQLVFEKHVHAPIEHVFALMSDFANAPQRAKAIKKIEMLTDGPVGLGTKFKETRVMFGKEATETMEVTAFDPPRGYNLSAFSCGTQYESTFQFDREGNGTNVKMIFQYTPKSFFAKLFSPLFKMMSGMMRKCVSQDLEDLAKAAEGTAMAGA
jgi:uncharacterized membrane protein